MTDPRARLIQEILDVDLARPARKPERIGAIVSRTSNDSLVRLDEALAAFYRAAQPPIWRADELNPMVFQRAGFSGGMFGAAPTLDSAKAADIKGTLLFSHRVVARDPLIGIGAELGHWARRGGKLTLGLEFWMQLGPLVEKDIVHLVAPEKIATPDLHGIVRAELADAGFRKRLAIPFPELAGPGDPGARRLRDAVDSEIMDGWGDLLPALLNLGQVLSQQYFPDADLWTPDRRHLELLELLASRAPELRPAAGREVSTPVTQLVEVKLPAVGRLRTADVVVLRSDSEVFESWRSELSAALQRLAGSDDVDGLRRHMQAVADRTRGEISRSRRESIGGALTPMAFGVVGGALGAAADGVRGAAMGAAGGALQSTHELLKTMTRSRRTAHVQRARLRHAMVLAEE